MRPSVSQVSSQRFLESTCLAQDREGKIKRPHRGALHAPRPLFSTTSILDAAASPCLVYILDRPVALGRGGLCSITSLLRFCLFFFFWVPSSRTVQISRELIARYLELDLVYIIRVPLYQDLVSGPLHRRLGIYTPRRRLIRTNKAEHLESQARANRPPTCEHPPTTNTSPFSPFTSSVDLQWLHIACRLLPQRTARLPIHPLPAQFPGKALAQIQSLPRAQTERQNVPGRVLPPFTTMSKSHMAWMEGINGSGRPVRGVG